MGGDGIVTLELAEMGFKHEDLRSLYSVKSVDLYDTDEKVQTVEILCSGFSYSKTRCISLLSHIHVDLCECQWMFD